MPLGLHFMANFMQDTVLGFGVSGNKEQGLFKAVSEHCPASLNGGPFGLEASVPGLIAVIITTILLYRWMPSNHIINQSIKIP